MVSHPKKKRTYCKHPSCKSHKVFSISLYKSGKASKDAQGARRYARKQQGYGGQTKPIFHKKAKTTKKVVLRMKCSDCSATYLHAMKRAKTVQLVTDAQRRDKAASANVY